MALSYPSGTFANHAGRLRLIWECDGRAAGALGLVASAMNCYKISCNYQTRSSPTCKRFCSPAPTTICNLQLYRIVAPMWRNDGREQRRLRHPPRERGTGFFSQRVWDRFASPSAPRGGLRQRPRRLAEPVPFSLREKPRPQFPNFRYAATRITQDLLCYPRPLRRYERPKRRPQPSRSSLLRGLRHQAVAPFFIAAGRAPWAHG